MIKWIIIIAIALSLSGCADTADAEDSTATTPAEQQENTDKEVSDDETWIAVVMTWNPVHRIIDKEFASEVDCWNYYETETNGVSVGESKFGTQHLDHQDNRPTKDFHFGQDGVREYPIRTYRGINDEQGSVWLTCDIKGRYEDL
jgi:uncharacterized protein YceK